MTAHIELAKSISILQITDLKTRLSQGLAKFNFVHTTIEFEFAGEQCRDQQDELQQHSNNPS